MRRCVPRGPLRGRGRAPATIGRTRAMTSRLSYAPSEAGVRVIAQDVRHIGVVGSGLMGSGIVEVCARAGLHVTFAEANAALIEAGRRRGGGPPGGPGSQSKRPAPRPGSPPRAG